MSRRREEVRPPISDTALVQAGLFPEATCLVCGKRATPVAAAAVPKVLDWLRGRVTDSELRAAVWLAHPGVEGCFVSAGVSICGTRSSHGVVR